MARNSRTTILTIEDDDAVRLSIAAYLEDRRFNVLQAANGRAGLKVFRRDDPDLILVDLRMPEIDGLKVLAAVTQESPDTPIIVASGTGLIRDTVEALHLGAWDYVLKPIEDMAVLLHAIERALERADLIRRDREHKEQLEQKVAQRTAELERFVYTVSHDLKTPLITIKWLVGQLQQDIAQGNASEVDNAATRIDAAAHRMVELLADVLELSRIGRLVKPSEDVSLNDLATEVLELVAGPVADRAVRVVVTPDLPVLYGDRGRLVEVLQNLVENAVKFIGDRPDPCIEIGARHDGPQTVYYVRDNGIGIDPRYHEKVFGLFERLSTHSEGTGIGLTLVKRIVELHGGRVWVESAGQGQGATFCFTIRPKSEQPT